MSTPDIIKDSIAPLVQRILSDPLHFKPAKRSEVTSNRPSSYITIGSSNNSSKVHKPQESTDPKPKPEMAKPRPTSLAQALAGYTSKRNTNESDNGKLLKKRKKANRSEEKQQSPVKSESESESQSQSLPADEDDSNDDDLGEALDQGSEIEESTEQKSEESHESSSESDDANYTDASGFIQQTPHNIISSKVFEKFQSSATSSDEQNEDEDDDADEDDEESADKENKVLENDEDDDEEDDEDYEDTPASEESSSEDDEEQDVSTTHPKIGTAEEDIGEDIGEEAEEEEEEDDDEDSDSLERVKQDLLADRTLFSPTPTPQPTSDADSADQELPSPPLVNKLEHFYGFNELQGDRGSNNSSRILKNWSAALSKSKPLGLLNHGVTCYTNAAVQAMVHIPAIQHYLDDVLKNKYKEINPRSVTHVLAETSSRMWDKSKKAKFINPKKLIGRLDDINCMMSEWQQEDSHEYFMSLLSRLQEDSTPKGRKLNESIIYDIFGGLLQQSVTCKRCGHVSKTEQEFYDLSLHLGGARKNSQTAGQENNNTEQSGDDEVKGPKYSIIRSIKDFFSPELIKTDKSDKSGYVCEKCKNRTNAIKICSIDRAPETLTVHLKRFRFNGNSSSKVKQGVTYPLILDLSQYTTTNEPVLYQLVSVVVHEGRSVSSGHYVAHCRQPDGSWATYDDEYINSIAEKQALRDPSAYYLIYSRLTHKDVAQSKKSNGSRKASEKSTSPSSTSTSTTSDSDSESTPSSFTSVGKQHSPKSSKSVQSSTKANGSSDKKRKINILQAKSPNKPRIGGLQPTNNLGNIKKKSLKKYSKNPKNPSSSSKRFRKY